MQELEFKETLEEYFHSSDHWVVGLTNSSEEELAARLTSLLNSNEKLQEIESENESVFTEDDDNLEMINRVLQSDVYRNLASKPNFIYSADSRKTNCVCLVTAESLGLKVSCKTGNKALPSVVCFINNLPALIVVRVDSVQETSFEGLSFEGEKLPKRVWYYNRAIILTDGEQAYFSVFSDLKNEGDRQKIQIDGMSVWGQCENLLVPKLEEFFSSVFLLPYILDRNIFAYSHGLNPLQGIKKLWVRDHVIEWNEKEPKRLQTDDRYLDDQGGSRIPSYKVKDWECCIKLVKGFTESKAGKYVFRGQRRADWSLQSTLSRDMFNGVTPKLVQERHIQFSKEYLPAEQVGQDFYPYWQHYGLSTPLLDWSYNFLVALFFAFQYPDAKWEKENSHRVIYVLNKSLISSDRGNKLFLDSCHENNSRIKAQEGLFTYTAPDLTLANHISRGFTESADNYLSDRIFKIYIPNNDRDKCLEYLGAEGISSSTMFPDDPEMLAKEVNQRFRPSLPQSLNTPNDLNIANEVYALPLLEDKIRVLVVCAVKSSTTPEQDECIKILANNIITFIYKSRIRYIGSKGTQSYIREKFEQFCSEQKISGAPKEVIMRYSVHIVIEHFARFG